MIAIFSILLGQRLEELATAGLGETLPSRMQELNEEFMSVRNAKEEQQIKTSELTTENPWSPCGRGSFPGTSMQEDFLSESPASKYFAETATPLKQSERTSEGGKKNDSEKVRLELISPRATFELGKVLTFGARKYAAHNWRKGIAWSRIIGAIKRHVESFNAGEDNDPETGLSHIAHAMCECMFLLEYLQTHPELDDRYKGEK